MNTPNDISHSIQEVRPMIEKLLQATDRMQSVMSVASLRSYISTGSAEQILAFYIRPLAKVINVP